MDYSYLLNKYTIDYDKLLSYGFIHKKNVYTYKCNLSNNMYLVVSITNKTMHTNVFDSLLNEEYILYKVKSTSGFVLAIQDQVEKIIDSIISACFTKGDLRNEIIDYCKKKYNTTPEYPWDDLKDAFTLKNEKGKWYGLVMKIKGQSLKIKEPYIDIMNIKCNPDTITKLIDNVNYYPAYHMNKKYWLTIILNNDTNKKELYDLLDKSYNLVK
jgi:predicted DNA-binding protein (MmcQ/YjbR family)